MQMRWFGSLFNLLTMRASTHTFVAFVDIEKAFDTSWVEATLVRLHDIGVRGTRLELVVQFPPPHSVPSSIGQ